MMPLCTTATFSAGGMSGCALTSLGTPWVAQRVWPMPTLPLTGRAATRRSSAASLPAARRSSNEPLASVASPAES